MALSGGDDSFQEKIALTLRQSTFVPEMLERNVTVLNRLGLHARPAAEFVRAARSYRSTITLVKNGSVYSASSILELLMANLDCGSSFTIQAEGPDAEEAVEKLASMMEYFRQQEDA